VSRSPSTQRAAHSLDDIVGRQSGRFVDQHRSDQACSSRLIVFSSSLIRAA
jgi:hypothetical protein